MPHWKKDCITIFLSSDCNLKCRYCYCEGDRDNQKYNQIQEPNLEFYKVGIQEYFNKKGEIKLRFFGNGEPTFKMDLVKELVEFSKQITDRTEFELQTNGFFNESICNWIGENIDIVWISCDGTPDIQDYYRPSRNGKSSSIIVERNIINLIDKVNYLGVRMTIGRENIYKQKEIINYLSDLGVKYIYSDLLFLPINIKDDEFFEKRLDPLEYAKEFLNAHKYALKKDVFYGSFFTINFDEKCSISCRCCNPSPHLTLDGYVSACDMAYTKDDFPELIYGKYDVNKKSIVYDDKKIKLIKSRNIYNMKECIECEVKQFCAGGCVGESLNENGSMFSVKTQNCEAIKYLAKELSVPMESFPIFHP